MPSSAVGARSNRGKKLGNAANKHYSTVERNSNEASKPSYAVRRSQSSIAPRSHNIFCRLRICCRR